MSTAGSTNSPARKAAGSGGYTLLELLVVLAIIAGMLAMVPPLFSTAVANNEARSAARQLVAALRYARSEAVATRRPVAFTLDLDRHRYQIGARSPVALPPALEFTLITAHSEVRGTGRGAIRFFADGSATGGRITLGSEARSYRLQVDWLTGQVSQEE